VCGDVFVQPSNMEQCDDGNLSNTDMCVMGCKNASCGDGFVQQGVEQCDDGNNVNTDACVAMCKSAVVRRRVRAGRAWSSATTRTR
jgi:cysteine-rich repeat protein